MLLHVGIKLPDIAYGLQAKVAEADVLTEIPWDENPDSHSNAGTLPRPADPGHLPARHADRRRRRRRGGGLTSVGQTVTPLEPIGLLAARQWTKGPQGVPVNRTADQARVTDARRRRGLVAEGRRSDGRTRSPWPTSSPERSTRRGCRSTASRAGASAPSWRGLSLLEVVEQAGGRPTPGSSCCRSSPSGFNHSFMEGPQVAAALLATHLNGQRLDLDHGYPLRLIAPNRAGVLNTKWLSRIEVLS